jgi:hypothetical protein
MTDDDRKPGAGWDAVEDLLAEEEIERQKALPAEERRAAMTAQGLDPDRAHAIADDVLKKLGLAEAAPPAAKVVSLAAAREKKKGLPVKRLYLLVAAAALIVLGGGGGVIVALNTPEPSVTTPVPTVPTAPPGPSPEEVAQRQRAQAEELRKVATAECADGKWDECAGSLGEAAKLDAPGDGARRVKRMRAEAERGETLENLESKLAPGPRGIPAAEKAKVVAILAASKGQALQLVCARDAEPAQFCTQLVAVLGKAGWTVTRTPMADAAPDAAVFHGMLVEVAPDADEATQAAADALAAGMQQALLFARGPHDAPAGGDAPLRLTVGKQ